MLRRVALLCLIVVSLSSCGLYPLPVSRLSTDILVRQGASGVDLLFCQQVLVTEVLIEVRDLEADGQWGDYREVVHEDDLSWDSGPESPLALAASALKELQTGRQLSVAVVGSHRGDSTSASTLIEISPEMGAAASSGSWINADGPTDEPCA